MRIPKFSELKEAVRSLFTRPYTSRFPYQAHKPYERFRGKPIYYEDDCVGCGACFQVCPAKAIEMIDTPKERTLIVHWDICIGCGQCQANCITSKGIMLSNEFDLSTTESRLALFQEIKKKMFTCDSCGAIIAPYDHLAWVARKIGPLVFSNASLMLFYLKNIGPESGEQINAGENKELRRADRFNILCPHCRREAVIKS